MVDYMKRTRIKAQTKQWWKRMKKQVDDKKNLNKRVVIKNWKKMRKKDDKRGGNED
jgi:hypothetical protein